MYNQPPPIEAKLSRPRRSFTAVMLGRRAEVFVSMDHSLWYYNDYQDAERFDERVGQVIVASHPLECIKWIKAHTPKGPAQDEMLEYFSWHCLEYYFNQRREKSMADAIAWEEDRKVEERLWYAKEEARLNAEAAALEEPPSPPKLEIEPEIQL